MSVKSFVESIALKAYSFESIALNSSSETIQPKCNSKLIVYLDSKIYPNEFGISVRPLQCKYGSTVIDMKQLIDIFGKVPYITVKENRYRSVYRDPMIMTIDLTPKTYLDNTYYEYYIDKLCLRSELKRYLSIEKKAHEAIKEFKQSQTTEMSVDEFRRMEADSEHESEVSPI
ncbi:hypothetical protein M9Y10_015871 [Tritrichomonas musculus]|uniref:Uncharacterized protein n=1 Tax=Tritrichomonas musculus TaxID=1915356 RepID=A0ABR2GJ25_9EUKA